MEIKGRIWAMSNGEVTKVNIEGHGFFVREVKAPIKKQIVIAKKKPYHKYKKYKTTQPKGTVGYDKTYGIWVREADVQKVKNATQKFGFEPTMKNIAKETGLTEFRASGTVHYLVAQKILKKHKKENRKIIYKLV